MKKISLKKQPEKKTEREKVEERREEVLARGRKFKYPLQYAKHRLVMVTIIVVVVALAVLAGAGYFALYKVQSESSVLYRITQVIPVSVAEVDGVKVRYSDYMMIYRSTITPVEQQQGKLSDDEDSQAMRAHYKRLALDSAEEYAYAEKIGKEKGIEVTREEIDTAYTAARNVGGTERSEDGFKKILADNFGLTESEYRRMIYLSLMKQKVAGEVDDTAAKVSKEVEEKLKTTKDLRQIAEEMGEKVIYEETGGLVDKMNVDGGRAEKAASLAQGEVSEKFVSSNGDGYYFVKLVEKTDTSVNYGSIKIRFTALEKAFKKVEVKEYITLEATEELE